VRRRLERAHRASAEQRSAYGLARLRSLPARARRAAPGSDRRGDFNLTPADERVPGDAPPPGSAGHARYLRDLHACEKRVGLARRISKIIDEDSAAPKPGDL
jgi:hypothetical protein